MKDCSAQPAFNKSVNFDPALELEIAWGLPFHVFTQRFKFEGFANAVASKGKDGFGVQTEPEFLLHAKLKYDFGELIFQTEHVLEGGVGYEYWKNKFGNNAATTPGAEAKSPFVFATVYF